MSSINFNKAKIMIFNNLFEVFSPNIQIATRSGSFKFSCAATAWFCSFVSTCCFDWLSVGHMIECAFFLIIVA